MCFASPVARGCRRPTSRVERRPHALVLGTTAALLNRDQGSCTPGVSGCEPRRLTATLPSRSSSAAVCVLYPGLTVRLEDGQYRCLLGGETFEVPDGVRPTVTIGASSGRPNLRVISLAG